MKKTKLYKYWATRLPNQTIWDLYKHETFCGRTDNAKIMMNWIMEGKNWVC